MMMMTQPTRKKALRSSIHLIFMAILSFTIGFFMSYDAATMREKLISNEFEHVAIKAVGSGSSSTLLAADAKYTAPSTTLELLGIITMKQKQKWNDIFKEYGRFTQDIFNTVQLEHLFRVSPLSRKRLIRRIIIKILQGRIQCSSSGECPDNHDASSEEIPIFRWVTSGDSSAAGHGNAYSQSYTSILENTVVDVFAAAGIKFIATNHAGDVWSGMELALCMESIFGRDVDVLSWDFSLSSPREFSDPLSSGQGMDPALFGERAGRVLEKLPFVFFLRMLTDTGSMQRIDKLQARGVGTGLLDEDALKDLILTFPDQNRKWVPKSPPSVEKFHCSGKIEGKERCDDPSQLYWCNSENGAACVEAKFDAGKLCKNDQYQTSWNDGKKMHLLKGRLLGYQMIEMLRLAVVELDTLEQRDARLRNDPLEALHALRADEEVEEFLFLKTQQSRIEDTEDSQFDSWDTLKLKSAICFNAMAISKKAPSEILHALEFEPAKESLCEEFRPFQNAFLRVTEGDQYVHLDPWHYSNVLGEPRQIVQANVNERGILVGICLKKWRVGKDKSPIPWEKVEIRVNGILVSDLKPLGGCYFLKHLDRLLWDDKVVDKSSEGIKIRIHEGGVPLILTSAFILY